MKEETESDFDRHKNRYCIPDPQAMASETRKNVTYKNILVEKEGHSGGGVIKM